MSLDDYLVDYSDPKQVFKLPEVQEMAETIRCKILKILLDGKPHSTRELMLRTGAIRPQARIHELRKMGFRIDSWAEGKRPVTWYYQLDIEHLPFTNPLAVVCGRART